MKRFTETDKWRDPWFRKLSRENKVFWEFLRDHVDNAGFWKVDMELAAFLMGFEIDLEAAITALNEGKERVRKWDDRLELVDFIGFQFGVLSPDSNLHKSVIQLLEKHKNKGYMKGSLRVQVKEKVKVEEKKEGVQGEKTEGGGETGGPMVVAGTSPGKLEFDQLAAFASLFDEYPSKLGRSAGLRAFCEIVISSESLPEIRKALGRYKQHLKAEPWKQPMAFSRWILDWRDWLEAGEPVPVKKADPGHEFCAGTGKNPQDGTRCWCVQVRA